MAQAGELRSGYLKVDFHVHTPWSSCYEDHMNVELNLNTSPEDIVQAALTQGLSAIAITDHNTAQGVDPMRRVASRNGLTVIPGVEFTTRSGHCLAFFDPETPVERLEALLQAMGCDEERAGKGWAQLDVRIDEASEAINSCGGLAIAAHVDRRQGGFMASDYPLRDKIRIHTSHLFSALEITLPQERSLWNQGQVLHFPTPYACIQGSDAHSPSEIGRRPVYLKVPDFRLESLRLAFRQYEERVRFPQDLHPPVEGRLRLPEDLSPEISD